MSFPLYFRYIAVHYAKNVAAVLLGLAFAFAAIDYFQNALKLDVAWNYKILYIFYQWEQALGLLFPLAIVFGLIMTKLHFVKNGTMTAFHAFGFENKRLLLPVMSVAAMIYIVFLILQTTDFAYAKDKAKALLHREIAFSSADDVFFKYNDTFVYMGRLDPVRRQMYDVTIFKVGENRIRYTMHAKRADFDGDKWDARDVLVKYHIYGEKGELLRYDERRMEHFLTLEGYKPKIITSLYEGKAMNLLDALTAWILLHTQGMKTDKIRAAFYEKAISPLFALALVVILFIKLPIHHRSMHWGQSVAYATGTTFVIWGVLYGLAQIGKNGVLPPEVATLLPVATLWAFAIYLFFKRDYTR